MRFVSRFRLKCFCAVLSACLLAGTASAITLEAVLEAMPPDSAAESDALFDRVLEGPDALLFALTEHILPADQGPRNAAVEFALYGLAKHVVRPDMQAQRVRVTRVLEMALNSASDPDVQRFFMHLLQVCGDATTVRALEPFVCEPAVYDDAVQAISAIGGFEALLPLFTKPCPDAPGKDASVQNALAHLTPQPMYSPQETGLSGELLAALANPDLAEDPVRVIALCREALEQGDLAPRHAAMVLYGLVRLAGNEALPDLLRAANSPHRLLWGMALMLASEMEGNNVSQAWVSRLPEFNENLRPQVITMLSKRGDAVAWRAVREAMGSKEEAMRFAAFQAITPARGRTCFLALANAMKQADSAREIQAIKHAMLRLPKLEAGLRGLLTGRETPMAESSVSQKVAYLEIITERQAHSLGAVVLERLADEEERVRRTAYDAMAVVGGTVHLPLLFGLMLDEERKAEADAAGSAITSLAERHDKKVDVVARIARLLDEADAEGRVRLLAVLADMGNEAALELVRATAEAELFSDEPDEGFSEALLDTVGAWRGSEASVILLQFWQRLDAEPLRLKALNNYIASAQRGFADLEKQRELFEGIREQCRTGEEQQAVAAALEKTVPEET